MVQLFAGYLRFGGTLALAHLAIDRCSFGDEWVLSPWLSAQIHQSSPVAKTTMRSLSLRTRLFARSLRRRPKTHWLQLSGQVQSLGRLLSRLEASPLTWSQRPGRAGLLHRLLFSRLLQRPSS